MPHSTELMEKFQNDYGFNKSFDELVNEGDVFLTKFRAVKRFGQKEPNRSPEQKKYMNGLFYMLSIVIDKRINPSEQEKEYNLRGFSVVNFIDEYEKIMLAKHAESDNFKEREPYEGIGVEVMKTAARNMQAFNKPLANVWADRIRREKFDIDKMRSLTDSIYQKVANEKNRIIDLRLSQEKLGDVGSDSEDSEIQEEIANVKITQRERDAFVLDESDKDDIIINERSSIETAVIMHEALKNEINSRTVGMYFQPRNWWRFAKEYFYEKALDKQIKEYKKLDENIVDDTLNKYDDPVSNEHESLNAEKTKLESKARQASANNQINKEHVEIKEKVQINENSAKEINNPDPKKQLINQIQKISGMREDDIESVIDEAIDAADNIRTSKEERDYVPPADIEKCAINPFKEAFELLTNEYSFSKKDAVIKAQKITNLLTKAYAPKEIIGNEGFEKISDNYVVKNEFALEAALSHDPEYKQIYNDLQNEYSKEKMDINLGDDHSNEQKSERVEDVKSHTKSISIN